jgi:hypothetical protein
VIEGGEEARIQVLDEGGALLGGGLQRRFDGADFVADGLLLGLDLLAPLGKQGFGLFHLVGEGVRFHHPLEDFLFDAAEVALRRFHLVPERLIFLVGLDRGLLISELAETRLVHGDIFFERAAGVLIVLEPLPGGFDRAGGVGQLGVDRRQPLGVRRDLAFRVRDGRFDSLELDQTLEVGEHQDNFKVRTAKWKVSS